MNNRNQTRSVRLRHTALAIALGMSITGVAMAQSRSAGSIFGNAEAGSTVTIKSQDTGLTRTITLRKAKEQFVQSGVRLLGVVLNGITAKHQGYYYYYYETDKKSRAGARRGLRFFGRKRNAVGTPAEVVSAPETAARRS